MEIERWAWERDLQRGNPVPDFVLLPDQMAYTAMRNILTAVKRGTISKRQATAERAAIRLQYDRAMEQIAFDKKLTDHHVRILKETELACSECRKNPTPENAIRLCNIIDGIGLPSIESVK